MDNEKSKLIDTLAEAISSNPQTEAMFNALIPDEDVSETKNENDKNNGGMDISAMLKLSQVMSGLNNSENDDRSKLLYAIRPFLSEERQSAVDSAIKLLKVASVLKLVKDLDILKDFKL